MEKGVIQGEQCVQAYDGLMTMKEFTPEAEMPQMLQDMRAYGKAIHGFDIKWSTKPFEGYTDEELEPFQFEHTNTWSHTYMNSLQGYDLKKRYFELFFLKVEKPKARFVRASMFVEKSYLKKFFFKRTFF